MTNKLITLLTYSLCASLVQIIWLFGGLATGFWNNPYSAIFSWMIPVIELILIARGMSWSKRFGIGYKKLLGNGLIIVTGITILYLILFNFLILVAFRDFRDIHLEGFFGSDFGQSQSSQVQGRGIYEFYYHPLVYQLINGLGGLLINVMCVFVLSAFLNNRRS